MGRTKVLVSAPAFLMTSGIFELDVVFSFYLDTSVVSCFTFFLFAYNSLPLLCVPVLDCLENVWNANT